MTDYKVGGWEHLILPEHKGPWTCPKINQFLGLGLGLK
jgi:hypothetical protein